MFEDLFIDRDTIARYRSAPLLEELAKAANERVAT